LDRGATITSTFSSSSKEPLFSSSPLCGTSRRPLYPNAPSSSVFLQYEQEGDDGEEGDDGDDGEEGEG